MIHVIITGPARDRAWPYRIEGHAAGHGIPISGGWSHEPLFDACRILAGLGEPPDRLVGVFEEGSNQYPSWDLRTTVGYGSRSFIGPDGRYGLHRHPFRVALSDEPATVEHSATPEEPPPPQHIFPTPPAYTGLAEPEPARTAKSHPKRKRAKSGAQRGLGRGR